MLLLLGLAACKGGEPPVGPEPFDRGAMLRHWSETLIRPGYGAATTAAAGLLTQVEALAVDSPDAAAVLAARTAWTQAITAWQAVQLYDFGPAENSFGSLLEDLGTFPADTAGIEAFIAAGDTSLANFDRDTRGFAALDYLLFAPRGAEAATTAARLSGPEGALRRAYLRAVARDLHTRLAAVADAWASYEATFVASTGSDAGSSTAVLYNQWVRSYENLKNFKLGLPLGLRPGQTQTEPARVEAYYSGHSGPLLLAHFEAVVALWEGPGWAAYLETVTGGPELVASTRPQIEATRAALSPLATGPALSTRIAQDPAAAEAAFAALQQLTRFFKSDLSSRLGISITYDSGDGD